MYVNIGPVAQILGVSCTTLRRWANNKSLPSRFWSCGGHRRYKLSDILLHAKQLGCKITQHSSKPHQRIHAEIYARVSGSKQKLTIN